MLRERSTIADRKAASRTCLRSRRVVSDGGFFVGDPIVPETAQDLSSFLHDRTDASSFEIAYEDETGCRERLLFEIRVIASTVEIPGKTPLVDCKPIAPTPERFTVPVAAIDSVSVIDPPQSVYTKTADTPEETAMILRRLADFNPDVVEMPTLVPLLDDAEPEIRREAVRALRLVSFSRPSDCAPALPALRSIVSRTDRVVIEEALGVLSTVANDDPANVAPMISEIASHLSDTDTTVRRKALECIALVADHSPADVLDTTPEIASIVDDGVYGRERAIECLQLLSDASPETVEPVVETLGTAVTDESLSQEARLRATVALGHVAGRDPGVGVSLVDDVATLLETSDVRLRNNAVAFLSEITPVYTWVVTQYTDTLTSLLAVDDTYTRINVSVVLARVAADFPDEVEAATDEFVRLLDDENSQVRMNACRTLGHLEALDAKEVLSERARTDDDPTVRTRAEWALSRLE